MNIGIGMRFLVYINRNLFQKRKGSNPGTRISARFYIGQRKYPIEGIITI